MPLPFVVALAYLVVNLALTIWIERERAAERVPPPWLSNTSVTLRWGPPLAGLVYLEVVAGDWLFLVFVVAFFALAFYLLDRLLGYPSEPPKGRGRS